MKRLTTENPGDNVEAALNLFYIKDYETWVRGGGPGPEYADVSLFDFTQQIVKAHIPDVDLPADNDDLSMMMTEWLCDEPDTAEGVIALLYTAAWSYAELRHRLAAIENILGDEYELERLGEMMEAEKDGRLVVLPCKVGDTVYKPIITSDGTPCVWNIRISYTCVNSGEPALDSYAIGVTENGSGITILFYEIGKTVFLTREAAEAALTANLEQ